MINLNFLAKTNLPLLKLSLLAFGLFFFLTLTIMFGLWNNLDLAVMVALQNLVSTKYDHLLSYLSLAGSGEMTLSIAIILAVLAFFKGKYLSFVGWLMIIPASLTEVVGKLLLLHPGPPKQFYRTVVEAELPSFAIHTDFSYPSGHMTRVSFLATVLLVTILLSRRTLSRTYIILGLMTIILLMAVTRISLGEHWFSDVLGGGVLGIAFGLLASSFILKSGSLGSK